MGRRMASGGEQVCGIHEGGSSRFSVRCGFSLVSPLVLLIMFTLEQGAVTHAADGVGRAVMPVAAKTQTPTDSRCVCLGVRPGVSACYVAQIAFRNDGRASYWAGGRHFRATQHRSNAPFGPPAAIPDRVRPTRAFAFPSRGQVCIRTRTYRISA